MNVKFSKNDGKKKNIPQLKKKSSNSFSKIDSLKKKTKKIDSFIWGKVLNYGVMGEALCLPGAKQNKDK